MSNVPGCRAGAIALAILPHGMQGQQRTSGSARQRCRGDISIVYCVDLAVHLARPNHIQRSARQDDGHQAQDR